MHPFPCIDDMWQYLLFCPMCQEPCRKIDFSVGLDSHFTLESYYKDENELEIKSYLSINRKKYLTNFKLNCLNDKYTFDIYSATSLEEVTINDFELYFYFYMGGICDVCDAACSYSSDIELDNTTNVVTNIGLEAEIFTLKDNNTYYEITYDYLQNYMSVLPLDKINDPKYDKRGFRCPISNIDFSNKEKAVDKIRNIILFS